MKLDQLIRGKCFPFSHLIRINWQFVLLVSLLLSLIIVSTAYAGVTWGAVTGPTWDNPGYTLNVTATLTDPQTNVCFVYLVDYIPYAPIGCTATSTSWACTIPYNYNNAYILVSFMAGSNALCTNDRVYGPTEWFTTGPTAIKLSSFTAKNVTESSSSTGSILGILTVVVLLLLALVWMYRSRKNRLAIS
jgi:hypothetical protein